MDAAHIVTFEDLKSFVLSLPCAQEKLQEEQEARESAQADHDESKAKKPEADKKGKGGK